MKEGEVIEMSTTVLPLRDARSLSLKILTVNSWTMLILAETEKEGDSNSALLAKWKAADELRCKSMATTCKGTLNRAKKRILELEEEINL